jgi:hypothetical protein
LGGFAITAYPARYGSSGIMTFVVNQDGVNLQKDYGDDTEAIAAGIMSFNPELATGGVLAPAFSAN